MNSEQKVTKYRNVTLSRTTDRGRLRSQTKVARSMFKIMGQCIKAGGAVTMNTWYDGEAEKADMTLEWPV